MSHYRYQKTLAELWDKAIVCYKGGNREANSYFDKHETAFLASIGMNAQELFDFAEDILLHGEPDFTTVAMIQDIRRSYFFEKQGGKLSSHLCQVQKLPPKQEEINGIAWLPRIIEKAKAKLRGEMPAELMYLCGGDRKFFKQHDIHPAEFLRFVAEHEEDDDAVVRWVEDRSEGAGD